MSRRVLGELSCHVDAEQAESGGDGPRLAIVLCHGFGAPAEDLVPIGAELRRTDPGVRQFARFYFPAAPIDLTPFGVPGGRAWWPIEMDQLVRASELGRWEDVPRTMPMGMAESPGMLLETLEAIRAETGLPGSQIIVGGFSQGAMLATDVALRLAEGSGGLWIASGALLTAEGWSERAGSVPSMEIIQGHGRADPLLPFAGAVALRDLLAGAGHHVDFLPFDGGHTIDVSWLSAVARRLASLV